MATLTPQQLAEFRRTAVKKISPIDFDKPTINGAAQKIEDLFTSVKTQWVADLNDATAPYTFTNAAKKELFKSWFLMKFNEEDE